MRRVYAAAAMLGAFWFAGAAHANPWPKDDGAKEIISTLSLSKDRSGLSATGVDASSGLHAEYGVSARTTVLLDTAMRQVSAGGATASVFDNGWAGGRVALYRDDDSVVSAEALFGVGGIQQAPNNPAAIALQGTGEARLMYGRGFTLWSHHAFSGMEFGWHWRGGPPADEFVFDAEAGWEPWSGGLVLLQSFSLETVGTAKGAYVAYGIHKLQFSVTQRITETFRIQLGVTGTVLGAEAGHTGLLLALWYQA